jgi:pimeloyl-ACP methyl ester carboxylesterase
MDSAFIAPTLDAGAAVGQLVLVPGLGCTEQLFAGQVRRLARHSRVRFADTRRDDTIAGMARRLLEEVDGPFALAGLSMGGYVAMEIVRQAPSRVTRLALLDTTAAPDAESAREFRLKLSDLALRGHLKEVHEVLWPRLVAPSRRDDSVLEGQVYSMLVATGGAAFARQQNAIIGRADSRPVLKGVAVPTLIVVGSEDIVTPVAAAAEMAGLVPGARLTVVEGSGHLSTMEAAATVAAAMEEWLTH